MLAVSVLIALSVALQKGPGLVQGGGRRGVIPAALLVLRYWQTSALSCLAWLSLCIGLSEKVCFPVDLSLVSLKFQKCFGLWGEAERRGTLTLACLGWTWVSLTAWVLFNMLGQLEAIKLRHRAES